MSDDPVSPVGDDPVGKGRSAEAGLGTSVSVRKIRTFVAVPLPSAIQVAMHGAAHSLSERLPDVTWSRKAENLHITLRFLGQVDGALLDRFAVALAEALGSRPAFEIGLRGLGAFPSARDARVIWVGVEDPSCRLADVATVVEAVADRFALGLARTEANGDANGEGSAEGGAPVRPHAFRAHVTVGRTSRRARQGVDALSALEAWPDRAFGRVAVREIHVYESITGGDASTYVLRGKATLQPC